MGSGKKGGGSQLAQLRSGLRDTGVTGSHGKRARSGGDDSRVGQYRADQKRKRLDTLVGSLNAFDEKVTHQKHKVLGRKVKGTTGAPLAKRTEAQRERREKLLPEYENRNHSSTFVDRRFGEYNPNLSLEEKMLQRFTHERQTRSGKATLFDLNDDDDTADLTHYGQRLSGLDEMPDVRVDDGDDDENPKGYIDAQRTQEAHFSGFDDAPAPDDAAPRNKNEVMKDIIARSKLAKHERQKAKDADEEMRMELDDELGDIRSLLFAQQTARAEDAPDEAPADDAGAAYDAFVREMAFERRAKPQDRLKSAEELAEEQAHRLHDAEAARLRRMRGEPEPADDDDASEPDLGGEPGTADVDTSVRAAFGLGAGLGDAEEEEEGGDEEDAEEEEEGEEGTQGEEDSADSDTTQRGNARAPADLADFERLDQYGEEDDTLTDDEEQEPRALPPARESVPTLPFTFPCPSSHDEFLDTLEKNHASPSQVNTIVSRIRTLHAPNLDAGNPERLQRLLGVLLDHVLYRTKHSFVEDIAAEETLLNDLVFHIAELVSKYPVRATAQFVSKLAVMHRNLVKGLSHGALKASSRTWPGLPELVFLRVCGLVWPTSDRWHPVATPLSLLEAQYLAHARVRSLADIASALYLCSLVASSQRASRRLFPEALNTLYAVAAVLLPLGSKVGAAKQLAEEYGVPTPDVGTAHTAPLSLSEDATPSKRVSLVALLSVKCPQAQAKADELFVCVELMLSFARLYGGSPAFVELFSPLLFLLQLGEKSVAKTAPHTAPCVQEAAQTLQTLLQRAASTRRALRLQAHRALSLASYAPKFDQQSSDPRRAADPDMERAQGAKLRAQLKKERKGAIRELRKDAQFLAEERERRRVEEDAVYKRKIHKIVGGLQDERSEEKQLEKTKAKIRKQAGKRK
ncbi:nucleolar complex protein 14 [Malassezia sp. CBS 17886]|nr:nucleolar complex protein 14 [Malassezia sp. CBS 17886]